MKNILYLFLLLPLFTLGQYTGNANQKITLGEQTTADGLIFRGIAADTTLTEKSDTAAYLVLDTVNKKLYFYKASAIPKWNEISGSSGGVDSSAIAYVNTYNAQTINGAKTFNNGIRRIVLTIGGSANQTISAVITTSTFIILNGVATVDYTLTLPDPTTNLGQEIYIKRSTQSNAVSSATNITPFNNSGTTTTIFSDALAAPYMVMLVSNGTTWVIMNAF